MIGKLVKLKGYECPTCKHIISGRVDAKQVKCPKCGTLWEVDYPEDDEPKAS